MVSTLVSHTRGKALAGLAMFVLVHICAHAQTTFTPPAVAPVPNPARDSPPAARY
jgi:hypothetical protein